MDKVYVCIVCDSLSYLMCMAHSHNIAYAAKINNKLSFLKFNGYMNDTYLHDDNP